jgi:hypothetical protein
VIGDVVRSRAIADRPAFQARLEQVLGRANAAGGADLAARWTVTLGDEFQGLYRTPHPLPAVAERICHGLSGQAVRFGIGFGPLWTPLRPDAVGMDGPCFHRARAAVEAARRLRRTVVVQPGEDVAERVGALWNLVLVVVAARTRRQIACIDAYRAEGTQARAAAALGVTQGTVSRELGRARFEEAASAMAHLPGLLAEAAAAAEPS